MTMLIGFVTGVLIIATTAGVIASMREVSKKSNIDSSGRMVIYSYMLLGLVTVIEFFIRMSLLLVDKL